MTCEELTNLGRFDHHLTSAPVSCPNSSPPSMQDDVLPEDHKIYADELPRETRRGKSASSGSGGGRSNASGGRPTNAWSGFGSSAGGGGGGRAGGSSGGAAGGGGRGRGMAVIAGVRRLNVTKQEALRSKGVFKIAPPSKVSTRKTKSGDCVFADSGRVPS